MYVIIMTFKTIDLFYTWMGYAASGYEACSIAILK